MNRVDVKTELLRWARERADLPVDALTSRFPKYPEWESGEEKPTLRQLERFARATFTPIGYFFMSKPPEVRLPIPDFRTMGNIKMTHLSPNLLEMVFMCQQRQEWYREYAKSTKELPLDFVGSVDLDTPIEKAADTIRKTLGFNIDARRDCRTWEEALRLFISQADDIGILVMCSGVVMNNTSRILDPEEFRGFAMSDPFAPVVFINGADTKSAQMFTLAHEIAHIWLGQSALSDAGPAALPSNRIENWCNRVAAELLVPMNLLLEEFDPDSELSTELKRLARCFKVSTLVVLRRIFDAKLLSKNAYRDAYKAELTRLMALKKGDGGHFHFTQAARVSKRFARALVVSTAEGRTLFRDAFRMLGIWKASTFENFARSLNVSC